MLDINISCFVAEVQRQIHCMLLGGYYETRLRSGISQTHPMIMIVIVMVIVTDRVNLPNFGCLLNTGNWPQRGPPLYSKNKGHDAAHQSMIGPKAAKWAHQFVMRSKAA